MRWYWPVEKDLQSLTVALSTDFSESSLSLKREAARYNLFHENVPLQKADQDFWNDENNIRRLNCYNFITNIRENPSSKFYGLIPGQISVLKKYSGAPDTLDEQLGKYRDREHAAITGEIAPYAAVLRDGAQRDGLKPLGFKFALKKGHATVGLFLRSKYDTSDNKNDFHWYVLCNGDGHAVWASKHGRGPVQFHRLDEMFKDATATHYYHFAGYLACPLSLPQDIKKRPLGRFILRPKTS